MKPAAFSYHRATSADSAVALLAELGEDAKVIAGGQSLLPIMNMRLAEPAHLVDLAGADDLRDWQESDGDVTLGAMSTHGMIEDGLVPDPCNGLLQHAASGIGYRAIRNRGTIGGSLSHADSSAEWPTVLSACDAAAVIRSVAGTREVPLSDFFFGFFSTALQLDEVLVAVRIPRFAPDRVWGFVKTNRKLGEFAESLAVVTYRRVEDAVVSPRVWLGAARDVPVRLAGVEALLSDDGPDAPPVQAVRDVILTELEQDWDAMDPGERHMAQLHAVTVRNAIKHAQEVHHG